MQISKCVLTDQVMFPAAGIERTGNRVARPTAFTVDVFSAGQGQVIVYLDHPDGTREEVCIFKFSTSASHCCKDKPAEL